ncbi:transcription regulator HTH, apses-type DNA-binding domain-containing protein [Radiomyces spectabilis]|uniref:transcription regulator HTH, apses-type DNA-binding domain-containing protein n=1 Tax=Radiomyces spectabilis TaxID=64574 RepID=UPI00221F9935|nr:transcription regulator HTH, apses-type DNA-binding domain-containing protein [Radiomyces spectabilis]KAI8391303.1 transcription regulator HTH, apses-type DNA-binding domain-containing protein [Radiomyces spectabilis]
MPVLPIQHQHTSPTPPPPPPAAAAPPSSSLQHLQSRPKITTSIWEDEGTLCYQVDTGTVCVARRQDNDMVNGTKLLNVTGMSRGKRDGILKNEKGRVVVKVGAMHLKGVWVTYSRAKALALQYNIMDALHPLLVDDPGIYFFASSLPSLHPLSNYYLSSTHPIFLHQSSSNDMVQHDQYSK